MTESDQLSYCAWGIWQKVINWVTVLEEYDRKWSTKLLYFLYLCILYGDKYDRELSTKLRYFLYFSPHRGIMNAEIQVSFVVYPDLSKGLSCKAWSGSQYSFACSTYFHEICPSCFCHPISFILIWGDFFIHHIVTDMWLCVLGFTLVQSFMVCRISDTRSWDSLLVRAPDSWSAVCKFQSWQEGQENFLLQSQLCVLTLIRCPFHPRVTAVARKRLRSFYQKSRWQVTPKHAYSYDPTKSEWADYAAVQV